MAAANCLRETALAEQSQSLDEVDKAESTRGLPMNIKVKIDKLRADAAECVVISSLATDSQKRVFFEKLSVHLVDLASEIEASLREPTLAGGGQNSAIR